MTNIPVLLLTYNRLSFSKKALRALRNSDCGQIYVIDNNSTDGTIGWLNHQHGIRIILNDENRGVAGAMNQFIQMTSNYEIIAKVDNDTIVPPDFFSSMLKHMDKADIIQAKHALLKETHESGFDDWVKNMKQDGALRFNHFVGGSGILMRRSVLSELPNTEWVLGGFRAWQREHPEVRKAFATDIEIKLLDTDENGSKYEDYPEYYKGTGRLC